MGQSVTITKAKKCACGQILIFSWEQFRGSCDTCDRLQKEAEIENSSPSVVQQRHHKGGSE